MSPSSAQVPLRKSISFNGGDVFSATCIYNSTVRAPASLLLQPKVSIRLSYGSRRRNKLSPVVRHFKPEQTKESGKGPAGKTMFVCDPFTLLSRIPSLTTTGAQPDDVWGPRHGGRDVHTFSLLLCGRDGGTAAGAGRSFSLDVGHSGCPPRCSNHIPVSIRSQIRSSQPTFAVAFLSWNRVESFLRRVLPCIILYQQRGASRASHDNRSRPCI